MKKILLLVFLWPLLGQAQKIPDFGFNKVRIADGDKIIQAEILPVAGVPGTRPHLVYYWYSANVIHTTQGGFSGRLLNGSYTEYYTNKNLEEQGTFNKGLKNGVWKIWADNGLLTATYTWNNGVRSGHFVVYDEQGRVKQSGKYRNDAIDSVSFWHRVNIFKKKRT
jgi:antitoxin component YwqK of YwqJK toxin-antitoxin module